MTTTVEHITQYLFSELPSYSGEGGRDGFEDYQQKVAETRYWAIETSFEKSATIEDLQAIIRQQQEILKHLLNIE